MWLDPGWYRPRNAYVTRNDATYLEDRVRIQWGRDGWVYRGWQWHDQENHLERSLKINKYLELKWNEKRINLYLRPYRRFGMPVVWRIWTRYFPSTSLCVEAYSTASQYIRLSLQGELSLLVNILQMALRVAFRPHRLLTRDNHASRAFVSRWNFRI